MSVEKMAAMLNNEVNMIPWEEQPYSHKAGFIKLTRAALSFLGFPEGCEPEAGCVAKAVEVLEATLDDGRVRYTNLTAVEAGIKAALAALGGGGDERV